jgi:hypothetical protein
MSKLRLYEEKEAAVLRSSKDGFTAEDQGLGRMIVTRTGSFVAGTWGGSSEEDMQRVLLHLVAGLNG